MSKKIIFRCNCCNNYICDYVAAGEFTIEIKCSRCKRFLTIKGERYNTYLNQLKENTAATVKRV